MYSKTGMNETFPNVTMGSDTWGCYDPVAGVLMADKALKSVWKLFQKLGGTLFDNCVVKKITPNGNETKISLDSGQVLTCKSVVICAGPWTNRLLEPLGLVHMPNPSAWTKLFLSWTKCFLPWTE